MSKKYYDETGKPVQVVTRVLDQEWAETTDNELPDPPTQAEVSWTIEEAEKAAKEMDRQVRRDQILEETTSDIKKDAHLDLAGIAMFSVEAVGRSLEELVKFNPVWSLSASKEGESMDVQGNQVTHLSRLMSLKHIPAVHDFVELYGWRYPEAGWQHGKVSWIVRFVKEEMKLVTTEYHPSKLWRVEIDTWWELTGDEVTK